MTHLRAAGFLSNARVVPAAVPASADRAETQRAIEDGDAVALVAALQPLPAAGDVDAHHRDCVPGRLDTNDCAFARSRGHDLAVEHLAP